MDLPFALSGGNFGEQDDVGEPSPVVPRALCCLRIIACEIRSFLRLPARWAQSLMSRPRISRPTARRFEARLRNSEGSGPRTLEP